MNEDQHIIKFDLSNCKLKKYYKNEIIFLYYFNLSIYDIAFYYIYVYLNIRNYRYNVIKSYNILFNISSMLYKIHNPNYYRKYNHKELI